ncbi:MULTISPECIES: helix-turn-helix domain-containing protein [Pseudomonas putida group]|uniref:helix-turn-helix domain-containing protein n=1 Tax=Pseudomonas putida group TaxID=136845 RepID=UPI0009BBDFFC|nr:MULTISPECIES: helix-turn-helix domain-containing protein [Pseudomonas putida group]MBH3461954.1 helix-turn-helix domain-containing protein [Pseudomonas putida]
MHNNEPANTKLLTTTELHALDARIAANAHRWLKKQIPTLEERQPNKQKSTRGPKPIVFTNPFYGFIGWDTRWGRYPGFAMDIIEGIARLDWHDRPIGVGGKSMPLSVRSLVRVLERLPAIHNEAIEETLQLKPRHARRYFKAVKLITSRMMNSRPRSLIHEMDGAYHDAIARPEVSTHDWKDCDDANPPDPEVLARLHYDLRTLTQFRSAEDYEAEYEAELSKEFIPTAIVQPPGRPGHPQKANVMRMLKEGVQIKPIARATGVDPKTIRKWKDGAAGLEASQAA